MTKYYRIKAFSSLTSVTVRTLHYYDEIGLLKPSGKTAAGHRLYSENDLLLLEQITTLKFLGFSLDFIKSLVLNENVNIKNSLKIQAQILDEESQRMHKAAILIQYLLDLLETNNNIDWKTVTKIIEVIQMNKLKHDQWEKKFLTESEFHDFEKLTNTRSKKEWENYHKLWLSLLEEIKQNLTSDPGSEIGQMMAKKWIDLVEEIYGNYPQLRQKMWVALKSDIMPKNEFPYDQEVIDYITKATEILKTKKL